jgi:hypothetical protein
VVGIFIQRPSQWPPAESVYTRLVGAVLLEQDVYRLLEGRRRPCSADLSCSQQPTSYPGERLDKPIIWIQRGTTRRICASGMTARHSTLFTLELENLGFGIYTI